MSFPPETANDRPAALEFFIVAGEISGDRLGAKLVQALRDRLGERVTFRGVGGDAMRAAGVDSLFPLEDIAVMGFLPVIARLPQLLRRIRETADAVIAKPPHALIIVDSPDFTHRVARKVRARLPHLPVIDYVSPSVWAWRPGRAAKMRAYVDHILALLPFEPRAHAELHGPACTYVGHPLIERLDELQPTTDDVRRRNAQPPLLVVLPGSRRSEIARLLETFGATLPLLREKIGAFETVLPAVAYLESLIREKIANWPIRPDIVVGEDAKLKAFRQARGALAASGTVTLELGLAKTPVVVAYKVSAIEAAIARQLIRTNWISLPNIILNEQVYPEFLQDKANASALADKLADIMKDTPARASQLAALDRLASFMRLESDVTPSVKAASIVLDVVAGRAPA